MSVVSVMLQTYIAVTVQCIGLHKGRLLLRDATETRFSLTRISIVPSFPSILPSDVHKIR